jgi:enoyl-CoA hydratase
METLQLIIEYNIAVITFTRPKSLNALNSDVFTDINLTFDSLDKNQELKAVILTGDGKAFVAGADIAEMRDKTPSEAKAFSIIGHNTFSRIENFKVPVIAAVNGFALGGGLELALACDFIITSENAKFSAPEVNLGLIPGFNGTQRLYRTIGSGNAKMMLFTAEMANANEALRMGLVQKVVAPEELMNTVITIAQNIASKGPNAIKAVKKAINFGLQKGFVAGSANEPGEFSKQFDEQGREGMSAFLEKRKPNW